MSKVNTIEVYEAGSLVAINQGNITGTIEKAVVGINGSVNYQVIIYVPERHQLVVNDFEVTPVEGKAKKTTIGFASTPKIETMREVTVLLDENNGFVGVNSATDDVTVSTFVLNEEELAQFKDSQKGSNEQEEAEEQAQAEEA